MLDLITCYGRIMPRLAELLFMNGMTFSFDVANDINEQ